MFGLELRAFSIFSISQGILRPSAEAASVRPVVENPAVESEPVWREAKKVLQAQVVLSALASLILALVWGAQAGAWSLAGGAVCIAPSAWFASRLSRAAVRSPGSFAIWLFAGEVVKVLAMVLLLAAVFRASGARGGLALIAGFVAAMALGALWTANGLLRQVPATMVESFVAASVLVLGILLATRARFQWGGVVVVAVFALFHGAAHVADVQAGTTLSAYAAGFLVATVALHAAGFFTGAALARAGSLRWAGAGVAVAGLWMLQAAT